MKKICLVLCLCMLSFLFAQNRELSFAQARQIADSNARALWGSNLSPDEASPYYGPTDEIIAWQFNYSLGSAFPSKTDLIDRCDTALQAGDRNSAWANDSFANLVIGANRGMPVFVEYSKCLSQQYVLARKLERAASEQFPHGYELQKTYYLGVASVWFQISDAQTTRYVRLEPKAQWLSADEFKQLCSSKEFFWQKDDFADEWASYLDNAETISDRSITMIPGEDHMPFYAWNYGCVPISAAMIAAWWDSYHGLGKLIDSYYNRYDDIVDEQRTHTPRIAYRLAYQMETGSESGNTDPWDVNDGLEDGFADMGYTVDCEGSWGLWPTQTFWNEMQDFIREGTPGLVTIDEDYLTYHTTAAVGFNSSPRSVFVHDPNRVALRNVSRSMMEAEWYVYPELYNGYYLGLSSPRGGTGWDTNGTGETLNSGDMYEISWFANPRENTYVKLYYHVNGGFPEDEWILITDNSPNDGVYDWKVPAISSEEGTSSTNARIKIEMYDASTNILMAEDGSYGNFTINSGGSIPVLSSTTANINTHPEYFKVNHSQANTWGVIGVNDAPGDGNNFWKLELFDNPNFTTPETEAYLWDTLNYMMIDYYHHTPQEWGLKVSNLNGEIYANAQTVADPGSTITPGVTANLNMTSTDVVKVWNIYLEPADYGFELAITNSDADLDFAIYKWGGDGIFTKEEASASSSNPGGGAAESFHFSPFEAGYYGLVVSSRSRIATAFTVKVNAAGSWTGAVSNDWYNAANWSGGIVPNQNHNVVIPAGLSNYPYINAGWGNAAFVKTLTIEAGASVHVHNGYLNVYGDLKVFGQLKMTYFNGVVDVSGSIVWENGSTALMQDSPTIYCYGNWTFKPISNVHLENGYVSFVSSGTSYIQCESNLSHFYNIKLEKSGAASTIFSSLSTRNLQIYGSLMIGPNSVFRSDSELDIVLHGSLAGTDTGRGHYYLDHGSIRFMDDIAYLSATPGDYFNTVVINTQDITYLLDSLTLHGNLIIVSGGLDAGTHNIALGGSWLNHMGTAGFAEDTGAVIFNGAGAVYCSGEDFNLLVINNPLCELHFDTGVSTANSYNWTSGTLYMGGGTLTIDDLMDNGLYGNYTVQSGTLNITQNLGQSISLSGELHIFGGQMNVSGGAGDSVWPGNTHSWIEMSGGELNFSNQSIWIHSSPYLLTADITGGVIRTAKNFVCDRTDFMPEGGVIELNGSQDAIVSCTSPSHIPALLINKPGTRTNSVNLNGDMIVWGDLVIESGSFNLNGHLLVVGDAVEVSGSLIMTSPADQLLIGQNLYWYETAVANITAGEIQVAKNLFTMPGTAISLGLGNTFKFVGNEESVIIHEGSSFSFGNLILNKFSSSVSAAGAGTILNVAGNLTVNSGTIFSFPDKNLNVAGNLETADSSQIYMGTAAAMAVSGNTAINGLLDLDATGILTCHNSFVLGSSGVLNISGGSLILDKSYTGAMNGFAGAVNLSEGLLEVTNNGILIGSAGSFVMSGGTLKAGWSFQASFANTFLPTGGAVELTGARYAEIQCSNGNKFYDLRINKPSLSYQVVPSTNLTIDNDLIIQGGVFGIGALTIIANRDVLINGGRLDMSNSSALLKVGRNWNNTAGQTAFAEGSGTVYFFSPQLGTISGDSFYKVNIEKTATTNNIITYTGNLTVHNWLNVIFGSLRPASSGLSLDCNGNLSVQDGAGLNLDAQANSSLNLAGNLNDLNYASNSGVGFYAPTSSHLVFDGAADQSLTGAYTNSRMNLGRVTVNKSGGSVKPNCSMNFNGNVNIINGDWSYAVSGKSKSFSRDLIIEAGGSLSDLTAGISFVGTQAVNLKILGTASVGSVSFNKGSAANILSLNGNTSFTTAGTLSLTSGTLNLNGYSFSYPSSITIGSAGQIVLSPASTLILAPSSNLNLSSGAMLFCDGSETQAALITSSGYYGLNVNSGATIAAAYTIFEKMNASGINLLAGSNVSMDYCFTGCTFRNGASGGSLLTINNTQNLNIQNAVFPANTWSGAYNVSRSQATGSVSFFNPSGDFSGPAFENDLFSNVNWEFLAAPDIPQNVQINVIGDTAYLSWAAVADADGYNIYRSSNPLLFLPEDLIGSTEFLIYNDESAGVYNKLFYMIKAYRD